MRHHKTRIARVQEDQEDQGGRGDREGVGRALAGRPNDGRVSRIYHCGLAASFDGFFRFSLMRLKVYSYNRLRCGVCVCVCVCVVGNADVVGDSTSRV